MEEKVLETLDYIRPALQADGGDISLVAVDEENGIVKILMAGACGGCPIADVTMTQGIERIIMDRVPGVKEVVSV